MLGKIEGRRRLGRQDETVGWHHRHNGHEFEQTLIDGKGQFDSYLEGFLEKFVIDQLCLSLCDPMDCNTPGFPVHHQLPELGQAHVH